MSLLHILDELDQTQRLLEEEFPECKIGYSYRPGHVTWTAQLGPVLNADSPEVLRDVIKCAYVEVLEKISERTRGTSQAIKGEPLALAADGSAYTPVVEPNYHARLAQPGGQPGEVAVAGHNAESVEPPEVKKTIQSA